MKPVTRKILTALGFDIYWTLVVLYRDRGLWLWLALALLAWLRLNSARRRRALLLALAGCALDTLWAGSGLIAFTGEALFPLWMVAMWLMFATVWTWFTDPPPFPQSMLVLLATAGGPLAYFIGYRLGAITFTEPLWMVMALLAAGWGGLILLFHRLTERQSCVN